MQEERLFEEIRKVLKISQNEPASFMELITCIHEITEDGSDATCKRVITHLWPEEWQKAEDKISFEKGKWDLLRKRRLEINRRLFDSPLCFSYYIQLTPEKEFLIIQDRDEIRKQRTVELTQAFQKSKAIPDRKNLEETLIQLNQKFSSETQQKKGERKPLPSRPILPGIIIVLFLIGLFALYQKEPQNKPNTTSEPSWGSSQITKLARVNITIQPFTSVDTTPENRQLANTIRDEITFSLTLFPELRVFTQGVPENKAIRQTNSNEPGANYIIKGQLRDSDSGNFASVQIIDAVSGNLSWMEKWERRPETTSSLPAEISLKTLAAIQYAIGEGEKALVLARGTNNIKAYSTLIRAYDHLLKGPNMDILLAKQLCQKAMSLDSQYADAYALLAYAYISDVGWYGPAEVDERATAAIQQAHILNADNPIVLFVWSHLFWLQGKYELSVQKAQQAVTNSPDFFELVTWYGTVLCWNGEYDAAHEQFERALRINPGNKSLSNLFLGYIRYEQQRYEEAITHFKKNLYYRHDRLDASIFLAACYAALGEIKQAQESIVLVRTLDPDMTVDTYLGLQDRKLFPKNSAVFSNQLRMAGLP